MLELHRESKETKLHAVKCWPKFFQIIAAGHKKYEVRRNDRNYQLGDLLQLNEWHPPSSDQLAGGYTGASVLSIISSILTAEDLTFNDAGQRSLINKDSVVMGIEVLLVNHLQQDSNAPTPPLR